MTLSPRATRRTYDRGTITSSQVAEGGSGEDRVVSVSYETDEPGADAADRMRQVLEDAGFRVESGMQNTGGDGGGLWTVVGVRDAITYSVTVIGTPGSPTNLVTGLAIEGS